MDSSVLNKINDISFKTIDSLDISDEIKKSSETGLINSMISSNNALVPKLIINDYEKGNKVLSELIHNLKRCDEFYFSVAFITSSGILPLLNTLKELEYRGVKGKIITTSYLNFSEPKALRKLLKFSNITIKVYEKENFHTKGYIFKNKDHYDILVGSSNITQTALTKNKEWNLKISSLEDGLLAENVISDFNTLWRDSKELSIDWINSYEEIYKKQREFARKSSVPRITQYRLQPNKMQVSAISSLKKLHEKGEKRALLISATGTGKTYLSAFELREYNPKRALFIVHREQIAKQALESYKDVFGDCRSMGILSGTNKDFNSDFLFSTIQTLSKDDILLNFKEDEFDYIVIDEVHKAGAQSYQKIVDYFKPKFLLGMSATPERNDSFDIFKMFDYNIAYEIRLKQALEEDLLCPFHYFGISDIKVNGKELDEYTDFNLLTCDERIEHIIKTINYYGFSGNRVKGLIFCSSKQEAFSLSQSFNERGFNTLSLTGDNSQDEREEAICRLEKDEGDNTLDYIFTVDIFNEGVDIPKVNQIVMLRPTQSSIIFVQQLGRGLRKASDKEYVVVIDFIGNYEKNFLIPIALSGDRTFNKDTIRRYVSEGCRVIPGCSTINFDEISKKRIYDSIDTANFNDVRLIKESYFNLKNKLGRIPRLKDFDDHGEIDVIRMFENKSLGSYYKFLSKYDKEYNIKLSPIQEKYIEFISKKFASGKRVHELELIKILLNNKNDVMSLLKNKLTNEYNIDVNEVCKQNIINIMTNEFVTGSAKKTYSICTLIEKNGLEYDISNSFYDLLKDKQFYDMVEEICDFGISRFKENYNDRYMDTNLCLYSKYTYEDVCRLLNWQKGEVALNIGGYKYDKITKTYPVFINYEKDECIKETVKYEDRFIDNSTLIALSKSGRTIKSEDVYTALHSKELCVSMELFVRKNKDDATSKEFYYLGKIESTGNAKEIIMGNTNKNAVEIEYRLKTPVRDDIFEYLTSEG